MKLQPFSQEVTMSEAILCNLL